MFSRKRLATLPHAPQQGVDRGVQAAAHAVGEGAGVRSDGEKTTKNNKIKPQKTRGFNVKNLSNAKCKNYGC